MNPPQLPQGIDCINFFHIPKTAGSTFHLQLTAQYGEAQTYLMSDRRLHPRDRSEAFKQLSEAQKRTFKILRGHQTFGIHTYYPGVCRYLTFLRDPLRRVFSHYLFDLTNQERFEECRIWEHSLITHAAANANLQTALLAGKNRFCPTTIDPEDLNLAKKNLSTHFLTVGFVETFDRSLQLIANQLGWATYPNILPQNKSLLALRFELLPTSVVQQLESNNQLDMDLYAWAKATFAA